MIEADLAAAAGAIDLAEVAARFRGADEHVVIDRFLPEPVLARLIDEARALAPRIHRVWVPGLRKAGAVGREPIAAAAPALYGCYASDAMLDLASRITGAELARRSDRDSHGAALYYYDRAGDHVGFHYDACACDRGVSYTITLGLVNRTASRVQFRVLDGDRIVRDRRVAMEPGTLVLFCGSRHHHRVEPLAAGDERIAFSFTYARTDGARATGWRRLVENAKDALLYFGPRALVQRNYSERPSSGHSSGHGARGPSHR